jgi:hypothetical protein
VWVYHLDLCQLNVGRETLELINGSLNKIEEVQHNGPVLVWSSHHVVRDTDLNLAILLP